LSRAEPGRRGGRAAGGCLHHPRMLEKSRGTPYLVLQQPVKLSSSKAQCFYLGMRWDVGGQERDYKDSDVGSGFPHTEGVQDCYAIVWGQLL